MSKDLPLCRLIVSGSDSCNKINTPGVTWIDFRARLGYMNNSPLESSPSDDEGAKFGG